MVYQVDRNLKTTSIICRIYVSLAKRAKRTENRSKVVVVVCKRKT